MATKTLKSDSPNWLDLAVITVGVLMSDILVYLVVELEKILFVMFFNAVLADVEIGSYFGFVSFAFGFDLGIAVIAIEM